jgi:hypothetical protein
MKLLNAILLIDRQVRRINIDIERVNIMRIIALIATVAISQRCYIRYSSGMKDSEQT